MTGRRVAIAVISGIGLYAISLGVHTLANGAALFDPPFSLKSIYLFHALFSVGMVLLFEFISARVLSLKDQLGFLYLGSLVLKMMLFVVIFRAMLFYGPDFSNADSLALLIPLFIFLFYEVFFIARILNRND